MVLQNDKFYMNDFPLRVDKAIIVTSWDGHGMFLKNTLEKYMKTGAYVICSYDIRSRPPEPNIMKIPHAWVFKHRTYGAPKRNGWLWDISYASGVLSNFKNLKVIFSVNADCIWDKPEGINEIVKFLGDDCDMMASSGSNSGMMHTCSVMFKSSIFYQLSNYIIKHLKINISKSYSPEAILRDFIIDCNIKNKLAPIQPVYPNGHRYENDIDHYTVFHQDSTWKRILGYRNLGGEHQQCPLEHLEPLPKKYFDFSRKEYFTSHEQVLNKYYETNDRRWLYKYWAEGEDSYWNRRYYPIEYYGEKALHDDSKRRELGPPSERLGHFIRKEYQSFSLKDDEYYSKWKTIIDDYYKK